MSFVVFLDVDGVLNTRTTVEQSLDGHTGIDDARVEILAKVIQKMGGADIVLSSDWKNISDKAKDLDYLASKLSKYGLKISDQTSDKWHYRGEGIQAYLDAHPEVKEYVILDDNTFDFEDFPRLWERLLLTYGIERARFASETPAVEAMIFLEDIRHFSL